MAGVRAVAATVLVAAGVAAACGDGDTRRPDRRDAAGSGPVVAEARNRTTALLTDVRAARHEDVDRVVFEFRGGVPGRDVRYVRRPVRADGSGRAIRVRGGAVVRVRMENALDADLEHPAAPRTYTGPMRLRPATTRVVELVRVGGFEGVLTWAVGLRERVPFRVRALRAKPRLVVDFGGR